MAARSASDDHNLLFGALALLRKILDKDQWVMVCGAWAVDRGKRVPQLLLDMKFITPDQNVQLQQEVDSILKEHGGDAHKSVQHVLEKNDEVRASLALVDSVANEPVVKSEDWPGRYEKLEKKPRIGGIGQVWKTLDKRLQRIVALKELRPDRPGDRPRFRHEAQISSQLAHPHIVPVYELGEHENQRPFFTMQFIEGRTLAEACRSFRLYRQAESHEFRELVTAFVAVCQAVAYAHGRGVIHRDLKPDNVKVDHNGKVYLLDWGLARVLGKPLDKEQTPLILETLPRGHATLAGQAFGTPAYVAPEQLAGNLQFVDQRSDIYGLGAILFEILTGQPPFAQRRTSGDDLPNRPREIWAEVPQSLEAVCLKALAKEPKDRFGAAGELIEEVEKWLANEELKKAYQELEEALENERRALEETERALANNSMLLAQTRWKDNRLDLAVRFLHQVPERLRGASWGYLRRQMAGTSVTLRGHTAVVTCVSFSPDGWLLASASEDGTVKLWDANTGQELRTLGDHLRSVSFSPDGRLLASGGADATVKLWDVGTGEELRTLSGHSKWVKSVSFSPDGRLLASASGDGTVKLWDASTGQELRTLSRHSDWVHSVSFSPDGRLLASAGADGMVLLWDASTGQELGIPGVHRVSAMSVSFSPDGQLLASAGADGTVKLWNANTGQELRTLDGGDGLVTTVSFSPDGRLLASGGADATVKLWDVGTGEELRTLSGHMNWVQSVSFSPDGRLLASASWDRTVKLYASTGQELRTLSGHSDGVNSVSFSPDGRLLASASKDRTVKLWEASARQELRTLLGHSHSVNSVSFSPDGQLLASASGDGTVKLWKGSTGQELRTLSGHSDWVYSVSFSPDGRLLASASADRTVKLWDVGTGEELRTLGHSKWWVHSVSFSPDGRLLASANRDGTVKLWDVGTGEELRTLSGHSDWEVYSVSFSPDGRLLASASKDRTVELWDVGTGEELRTLRGHSDWVYSVSFSPDGRLLASASADQTVKLWDASTGQELRTLVEHSDWVYSVSFSPDGRLLASASSDGTVKLWDVSTDCQALVDVEKANDESRFFLRIMRQPNVFWHTEVAEQYEKEGYHFGAAFHWARIVEVSEDSKAWERLEKACAILGSRQHIDELKKKLAASGKVPPSTMTNAADQTARHER